MRVNTYNIQKFHGLGDIPVISLLLLTVLIANDLAEDLINAVFVLWFLDQGLIEQLKFRIKFFFSSFLSL